MFDEYRRSLMGMDSIYEKTRTLDVMSQLNSLHLSEWAKPRNEATMLKAVFGSARDTMDYLDLAAKSSNSVKDAFASISERTMSFMHQYDGALKTTMLQASIDQIMNGAAFRSSAASASLAALAGQTSISMQWNEASRMAQQANSVSKSLVSLQAEEILRLKDYVARGQLSAAAQDRDALENRNIREVVTESVERYVSNVESAIAEIAEMQDEDLSEVAFDFETAIRQDAAVGAATPLALFVLENVLATYNKALELLSGSGHISEDFLQELLKTTNPDSSNFSIISYIFVQLVMTWSLTYGYEFTKDKITGKPALSGSPINARTIGYKTVFAKAHGNSRTVCEISEGTEVQLHNVKGKYIYIKFLHDTGLKEGYALNNGFERV